ncbi:hypothetical protein [Actinoplanes philippinensis]|uniref:hypothetical protein n=1 Tax=Actinoplanes philippinensis TaxID=35752 RepID=UPI0033D6E5E6
MDIAQTSVIAVAVIVVAVAATIGLIAFGVYRARFAAAREDDYRQLAGRVADDLTGVRTELGEVRQRLAALEKLLTQIG